MKWSNRYGSLPCGCFVECFGGRAADGRYCCRICRGVRSGGRYVDVLHWVGGRSVVIPSGEVRDLIVYDSVTPARSRSGSREALGESQAAPAPLAPSGSACATSQCRREQCRRSGWVIGMHSFVAAAAHSLGRAGSLPPARRISGILPASWGPDIWSTSRVIPPDQSETRRQSLALTK